MTKQKQKKLIWLVAGALGIIALASLWFVFVPPVQANYPPEYTKSGEPVYISTDENEARYQLYHYTSKNFGKFVTIRGQITQLEAVTSDQSVITLVTNTENESVTTEVTYTGDFAFNIDDYIEINGYVSGVKASMFNRGPAIPIIEARTIGTSNQELSEQPAWLTQTFSDQSIEQAGVSITIEKIEYASGATRLYLSIDNQTKSELDLANMNLSMKVGNNSYQPLTTEIIPPIIASGSEVSGVLTFEAMKPVATIVTMSGLVDEDFVFILHVSTK